jgi:hypothetical protein
MPAWLWIAIVWAVSIPLAFSFARRYGFFSADGPVVALRVPIVVFVAPALAIVAVIDAVAGRVRPPGENAD